MTNSVMTDELWLPVLGYEGLYEVSSEGRVRSLAGRRSGRVLKSRVLKPFNIRGYCLVGLSRNGVTKTFQVHRLVMCSFTGLEPLLEVNHKDGNKSNNRHTNLEWVTHRENIDHAHRENLVDTRGEKNFKHKLLEEDVRVILLPFVESNVQLAEIFDVSPATITHIKLGQTWRHLHDGYQRVANAKEQPRE